MQALWRTLRNPSDGIAHVAFRVLGKFGGSNRKMLKEAQRLEFNDSESSGPCVRVDFLDCKPPVHISVSDVNPDVSDIYIPLFSTPRRPKVFPIYILFAFVLRFLT